MKVLNLVTNQEAEFFKQQVTAVSERGVDTTTVAVPGARRAGDDDVSGRSPLAYLRFYPRVLRSALDGYDLVHANYGLTAPAALAQPIRPVVLSLWGSDLFGSMGELSRWCARRADAVIVMSEDMARELRPIDSHVIPHGVDLDRFRPLPGRIARERIGWDHARKHVLFPYAEGRPVKDYPRAASVVEAARDRLDADVALQTLSGVAHDLMPLYLNAADALLLTSKHEGSPNTVKEALACNRPVVATDVGDVANLLEGVENAKVGRSDEELVSGLVTVLRRGAPSDGRVHVQSLGLERMGERIVDVYESAGGEHSPSASTARQQSPDHRVGSE
jgi:glycosyltransferase involved in cell wall biosynthesis